MTHNEASALIQEHTGEPLLEALEMIEEDPDLYPLRVQAAHRQLMTGFRRLMLGE